jgi:pimeloyl-ACP methyl ester carboxylesterase
MRRIEHGDLTLALHELRGDDRRAAPEQPRLLLVHALEGSGRDWTTAEARAWEAWQGPVLAVDLSGHGASDWRLGGAYTPELLAADVDAVLTAVGSCAVAGSGVGAWVALLVAGGRPDLVPAALLLPGAGLEGAGPLPSEARGPLFLGEAELLRAMRAPEPRYVTTDPMVRACASDVRPVDHATAFAARASKLLLLEDGSPRPPWWEAVRAGAPPTSTRAGAPAVRTLASPAAAFDALALAATSSEA